MITLPRGELENLQERARKLAREKSYLQLVNDLMVKLSSVTGVENTVDSITRLILENIGGSNVVVYYRIATQWHSADVYGTRRMLASIDNELARKAFESRGFLETQSDFEQTRMMTPEFTKASTWAMPLLVGTECVGVLMMEDMLMNAQEVRRQLEPFINYAALVLKNEILGESRLKRAYDEIKITQFSLDHASDSIFWTRPDASFANVNEATCRRLGYTREELLGMKVFDVDPGFPREAWDSHWREIRERTSFTIEARHRTKSGEEFPVEVSVNFVEYEGAEYNFAFARDITERKKAEEALMREREFSRALLESMADGVVACDADGMLTLFNRTAREWHGVDLMRLQPEKWAQYYDLFRFDGITPLATEEIPLARALTAEVVSSAGMAIVAKGLAPRFILANGSVIRGQAGGKLGAVVVMRDVTELKRVEDELRKVNEELEKRVEARTVELENANEQLHVELAERLRVENALRLTQFAMDSAADTVFWLQSDGSFIYSNKAASDLLGYSNSEFVDRKASGVNPAHGGAAWQQHWIALKQQRVLRFEAELFRKDGSVVPAEITANYVEFGGQEYNCSFVRDISERKRAEEKLARETAINTQMAELSSALLAAETIDEIANATLGMARRIGESQFGYVGYIDKATGHLICPTMTHDIWDRCGVPGKSIRFEKFGGLWGWVLDNGKPLMTNDPSADSRSAGTPTGHIPIKNFLSVPATCGDVMVGQIALANAARPYRDEDVLLAARMATVFALAIRRRLAEDELIEGRRFLESIVENIPNMIFVKDAESLRFVRFNKAGEELLGYPRKDLLGKSDYDFFPREEAEFFTAKDRQVLGQGDLVDIPEETIQTSVKGERVLHTRKIPIRDEEGRPRFLLGISEDITERKEREAFIRNILESVDEGFVVVDREYRIMSANRAFCLQAGAAEGEVLGRLCHVVSHRSTTPCSENGEECPVKHTFETGAPCSVTHTHADVSGAKHYVEIKSYPITDQAGKVVSAIETMIDITERRRLEEQLRQSQKMEAIGQLAGGVAHDFNNILTAIVGYGHLTLMKLPANDPLRLNMNHLLESADRAAQLTRSLLAFSRKQVMQMTPVSVNEIITRTEKFLRRIIGEDVELKPVLGRDALVLADAAQIEQVLMNLATNARDAMPHGGVLSIATDVAGVRDEEVLAHGIEAPGSYVVISVSDTGTGMDEETRRKIFEPFFTTKELGRGTGLGLAIVYGIVKQHHGAINVYSQPGTGSTFRVYLPVHHGAAGEREPAKSAAPIVGGTETILLAEDDKVLRTFMTGLLAEFGYAVIAAEDGVEAVRKFSESADTVRLCILDMVMPRKGGIEAYDEIARLRPGIKAILASGYAADKVRREGLPAGCGFIQKPAAPEVFLKMVRELLDREGAPGAGG